MSDQGSEKDIANLPDLGIKVPESEEEIEKIRRTVVVMVNELEKPDNYDKFQHATIQVFGAFGINPTTDNELQRRNEELWRQKYDHYHKMVDQVNPQASVFLDIEMVGQGAYSNFNLDSRSIRTLKGNKRITEVYPGACSIPQPVGKELTNRSKWHLPERNFYKVFEEVIGVDLTVKDNNKWPQNPHTLQALSEMKTFYVTDNNYHRVPAVGAWNHIKQTVVNFFS